MIVSFIICLLIFVAIGVASTIKSKGSSSDYLIANYSIKPWLVGISAAASNNSGYMFMGMIGYTYSYGLSAIWLMFGWIFGDFIASLLIHKKLRIIAQEKEVLSFAGVLAKWGDFDYQKLRAYLGIITVIFLGIYAAAQLNAGSKALSTLLGWDYKVGAIIGAIIVLLYCFAGGIRASIWTDAAQAIVMMVAMGLLAMTAIGESGGVAGFSGQLSNVSTSYTNFFPQDLAIKSFFGPLLFVIGWVVVGFGVAGQPHIMVRFMAMDNPKNLNIVRSYYYGFYLIFFVFTILVGLAARILLPDIANFDAELALPTLAQSILPEVLVGVILAGIFAATMSTADSQVLNCTAAITRDLRSKKPSYLMTKLATVLVTATALIIALYGPKSVFALVIIAWSFLAVSFLPLFLILAFGGRPSEKTSLTVALSGIIVMLIWQYFGLHIHISEIAPGVVAALLIYKICSKFMTKS